jgi:fused signal recognition particle receptor
MTTVVLVVVALVVAAIVVVALARGRGGAGLLPGPRASGGAAPSVAPKLEGARREAAVRPEPAAPSVEGTSAAAPAAPAGRDLAETAKEGRPVAPALAPESLPSSALVSEQPKVAPINVATLRKGLAGTRGGLIAKLSALFRQKKELDPATVQQIEEIMLAGDVGPKTTQAILKRLQESLARGDARSEGAIWSALRAEARRILSLGGGAVRLNGKPTVVLMVGVNGVGKTTTIGKLATRFAAGNKKVVLAAGDTFRAAAVQQLEVWGKRVGAEVIRGKEGADPGAVAFEATSRAKQEGADLLLVDTAGRLHTKVPLMDEIKKIRKTIAKALEGAPHETLLVLDATTGQNGLQQAAMFREALELTGVVLTKLDGTAKGGVVLAICDELQIPVRYVGLGERPEDLREFQADEFVEALFGGSEESITAAS